MTGGELEIERKARIDDVPALERRLRALARWRGRIVKEDRYYVADRDPGTVPDLAADPVFRVRLAEERAVIGWKRRRFAGRTEINEEHEIPVEDADALIDLFEGWMGLRPFVVKHKTTDLWILEGDLAGAVAEVNRVRGLGDFLEVEVKARPEDKDQALDLVDRAFEALGVDPGRVETRYYIEMLLETVQSRGETRGKQRDSGSTGS